MDQFLRPNAMFLRLLSDWRKYGSITVGFDFDQTVAPFHDHSATFDMVIQLLHELDEIGCKLVCWTANRDHAFVEKYLKEKGINHVGINVDAIDLGYQTRKPFYSALLDDRAGLDSVYRDLSLLVWYIKEHHLNQKTKTVSSIFKERVNYVVNPSGKLTLSAVNMPLIVEASNLEEGKRKLKFLTDSWIKKLTGILEDEDPFKFVEQKLEEI